ncbi:MAG: hypothetical protein AB7P08_06105 [Burkholderiales bacterium]
MPQKPNLPTKPILQVAEKAAIPTSMPTINIWHAMKANWKNSARAAKAIEEITGDVLDSAASVVKMQVWTDTNVRTQEIFLGYANRIKELTPAVVHGAVSINAAIESARPRGYEVLDNAQRVAQEVIAKSVESGLVTKEVAERRAAAVDVAHADDEQFFDALIVGAKVANRNIAIQAVNRVASVFEGAELPMPGRVFQNG